MASRRVLRSLSALEASCSGSVAGGTWDTPLHKFFSTTAVGNIQRVSNVVAPSWVRPHPTSGASAPSAQQQIAKLCTGNATAGVALPVPHSLQPAGRDGVHDVSVGAPPARGRGPVAQKPGLRTWEKVYWAVFVGAIGMLLFNRASGADEAQPDFEVQRRRRHEAARLLTGGAASFVKDDDPFAGMTPREIAQFLRTERKRLGMEKGREGDAFEGLSEAEILEKIEGEVDPRDPKHPRFAGMTPEEIEEVLESEKPKKLGTVVREFLGLPSKKRRKGASDRADGNEEAEKSEEKEERNSDSLGEVVVGEDEFEGLSPEEIDALAMKSASKESDTAG